MSSINEEIKSLQRDYASNKITRRQLWKGAAALGLSAMWIQAIEKGALAGPAPTRSQLSVQGQDAETTLIVAVAENVDTFDPGFTVGSKTSQTLLQNVFDQLTQYEVVERTTPDGAPYRTVNTLNIVGMIAESWTLDGPDAVFKIRPGVTYHNGNPFDANAAVVGYRRIFETNAIAAFLLGMGGGVTSPDAFTAPDASTFVMTMSKPNTLIPQNNVMHNTDVLDPKEIESVATPEDPWGLAYFKDNLATGNGPYKLESYTPDDSAVIVAAENYYGEQPFFTRVIMKIIPDATQRTQLLQQGEVDFSTKVPIKDYETLASDANVKILSIPSPFAIYLDMNYTIPPFDKKEVRQAVAWATPYDDIINQIYLGQAQPSKSRVPNGMPTSDFSSWQYSLDYDKAKELLAAAGFPEGEGLPEIKLTVAADDVQKERVAILMQDSLRNIGMNVTIEKLAYAAFNEQLQNSQLQFCVDEWLSWVNDPFYHMAWLADSKSPSNYPKFSNARVDELIAEFTLSDDAAGREAASKEIQAIMNDEMPYVYLCQPNWIFYSGQSLDGYVYYNDELPRFYHFRRTGA
jgi:peptide/nickel transport system substrate-binding protein